MANEIDFGGKTLKNAALGPDFQITLDGYPVLFNYVTNGQVIKFQDGYWVNAADAVGGTDTIDGYPLLMGAVTNGQVIKFQDGYWVNAADAVGGNSPYTLLDGYGSIAPNILGANNNITGQYSTIVGGLNNNIINDHAFVVGSEIATDAPYTTYVNNLKIVGTPLYDGYGTTTGGTITFPDGSTIGGAAWADIMYMGAPPYDGYYAYYNGYNNTWASTNTPSFVELTLTNLPTSDPQIVGRVWNDNGTLKISAGVPE